MRTKTIVRHVDLPGVGRVTCTGAEQYQADGSVYMTILQLAIVGGRPAEADERRAAAEILGWVD